MECRSYFVYYVVWLFFFYLEILFRYIILEMKRKIFLGKYEFFEEDWKFILDVVKDVVRR